VLSHAIKTYCRIFFFYSIHILFHKTNKVALCVDTANNSDQWSALRYARPCLSCEKVCVDFSYIHVVKKLIKNTCLLKSRWHLISIRSIKINKSLNRHCWRAQTNQIILVSLAHILNKTLILNWFIIIKL